MAKIFYFGNYGNKLLVTANATSINNCLIMQKNYRELLLYLIRNKKRFEHVLSYLPRNDRLYAIDNSTNKSAISGKTVKPDRVKYFRNGENHGITELLN